MVAGALAISGAINFGLAGGAGAGGVVLLRGHRLVDLATLALVAVNALLSLTDEIGLLDLLSLLVSSALFAPLIVNMRRRSRAHDPLR